MSSEHQAFKVWKSFFLYFFLPIGTLVFFLFTLILLKVPIYADEIAHRIYNSRSLIEGPFELPHLFGNICPSKDDLATPLVWLPGRYVSSILFTTFSSPLGHRVLGLVGFFAFLFTLLYLCRSLLRCLNHQGPVLFGLTLAPVFVGVAPLMLVSTRPETPLLLVLSVLALSYIKVNHMKDRRKRWLILAFLSSLLILPIHPKTVLFYPFILFALWKISNGRNLITRVFILVFFSSSMIHSFNTYRERIECPEESIAFNHMSDIQQITFRSIIEKPRWAITQGKHNLKPETYLNHIYFSPAYQSDWIRIPDFYPHVSMYLNRAIKLVFRLSILFVLVAFFYFVREIFIGKRNSDGLFFSFLLMGLGGVSFIQISKNFYESSFYVGVLSLLIALSTRILASSKRWLHYLEWAARSFVLVMLMSLIIFFGPGLFKDEPFGSGAPTYGKYERSGRSSIEKIILGCDLPDNEFIRNIQIDTMTYFFFQDTYRPSMVNFLVSLQHFKNEILNENKKMTINNFEYFLARCDYIDSLNNEMTIIAEEQVHDRSYCCAKRKVEP